MSDNTQSVSRRRELRVMVVDDDDFQREFVIDLLNDLGIDSVVAASGGADALAQFGNSEPRHDLIICDLQMPDIDGFDLLAKLSEQQFAGSVIIASGQMQTVIDYASLVAQVSSFKYLGELQKPFNKQQLETLIDRIK